MAVHEGIGRLMGIVPPTVTGGIVPPTVTAGIVPPMVIREDDLPTAIAGIVLPTAIGVTAAAMAEESGLPMAVAAVASGPVLRGVVFRLARMESAVPGLREVPRVRVASPVAPGVVAREVPVRGAPGTRVALPGVVPAVRVVRVVPGAGRPGIRRRRPSAVPVRAVPRTRWTMIAG